MSLEQLGIDPRLGGKPGHVLPLAGIKAMSDARDLALPASYTDLLGELKNRVRAARTQAVRTVNTHLIGLYWSIGKTILERQAAEGLGEWPPVPGR